MACHDVESSKMLHALRRFNVLFQAAVERFGSKLTALALQMEHHTEEWRVAHVSNITNPMDGLVTDEEKLERFAKLTAENHPILVELTARVDARLGTKSRVSIKSVNSIRNKAHRPSILREAPWFQMQHLRDSLRFMTAITEIGQVASILSVLLGAKMTLAKIDVAKLVFPKSFGWRFIAFDLRMPNGQLVEYYISFERLVRVMEDTHRIYEKYRQQKANVGRAFRVDLERSQKCYGVAFMRSIQDQNLGASSFILRWTETMEKMLHLLKTGDDVGADGSGGAVVAHDSHEDLHEQQQYQYHYHLLSFVAFALISLPILFLFSIRQRRRWTD